MDDHTSKLPTQRSEVGLRHNSEGSEPAPQLMLEWERLRLERQKYALEIRLKKREFRERENKSLWKDLFANPVTIAVVGGVIALITAVVTNYFNASETRRAEAAKAQLAQQSARETLQADLVKKFVEGPRMETVRQNLRFLIDAGLIPSYAESIQKYLDTNPGVAPQVGNGIEFLPSGTSVSGDVRERLQKTVNEYRIYLQSLGFPGLDQNVSVLIYSKKNPPIRSPNNTVAAYINKTIYLDESVAGDMLFILIEYTDHALSVSLDKLSDHSYYNEIWYAVSSYLPASFLGQLPPRGGSQVTLNRAAAQVGAWEAALWVCRKRVGQQAVDRLILPAWWQAMGAPGDDDRVANEFGKALIAAAPPVGPCFSTELKNRKLLME